MWPHSHWQNQKWSFGLICWQVTPVKWKICIIFGKKIWYNIFMKKHYNLKQISVMLMFHKISAVVYLLLLMLINILIGSCYVPDHVLSMQIISDLAVIYRDCFYSHSFFHVQSSSTTPHLTWQNSIHTTSSNTFLCIPSPDTKNKLKDSTCFIDLVC